VRGRLLGLRTAERCRAPLRTLRWLPHYVTFLDAISGVTFAVDVPVLLYNVYMKRLRNQDKARRAEHIGNGLDWLDLLACAG
jgi:hypothetical protein